MPPIFSIPSCIFIGPLGNTNVRGRLTSQEVAVLLVGCHFLGGHPTSQEDANLHVKISKNSTSRCWCGGRQVCPCAQGFPKNGWRSSVLPGIRWSPNTTLVETRRGVNATPAATWYRVRFPNSVPPRIRYHLMKKLNNFRPTQPNRILISYPNSSWNFLLDDTRSLEYLWRRAGQSSGEKTGRRFSSFFH